MKWQFKTPDLSQVNALALELRAKPQFHIDDNDSAYMLARMLVLRGITQAEAAGKFLSPSLSHLHSPYLMLGMETAIERIEAAIQQKEQILIYGDYDVDGTTAIVILKAALELCGASADFHVPHRIREGYDLREDVIERAAACGVTLIISVDAGIRAFAAAETARRLGVDLIVTDHHLPGSNGAPKGYAVLNPNQRACSYPCKSLCGAGVAFKVAQALLEKRLPDRDQQKLLLSFMKVAAIATIADSVPLTGENRVFARLGLEALKTAVNPGLKALLEVAQLAGKPLTSSEVAFRIAPRINAAGRMDVARDVIDLFSEKDSIRARAIANRLDRLNTDRQEEERRILELIDERFEHEPELRDAYCCVLDGEGWHRGVIGITATRVLERYGRPTIVISRDGEEAHGSGRSIRAFHLLNALESCPQLFTRFGGHAFAAGFSMPSANIGELRSHLESYARDHLSPGDFEPVIELDSELPLDQVTPELFEVIRRIEPFGASNHPPVFSAHVRLMAPPKVLKEKHLKLKLSAAERPGSQSELTGEAVSVAPRCHPDFSTMPRRNGGWRKSVIHSATAWRMAEHVEAAKLLPGDVFEVAFSLDYYDHPEFGGLELSLRDFRFPAAHETTPPISSAAGH